MMRSILLIIITFFTICANAQVGLFHLPNDRKRMAVDFENYDNMVVVEVVLQDTLPIKLILDSGIEGIIITDRNLVEYLEPTCLRSFKLSAPGNSITLDACVTPLVKMNLGNLEPLFSNVILLQEDAFSLESFIGAKVHGLIGIDKFRSMIVTINYDKNSIKFTRPDAFRSPVRSEIIPLSIVRGRPYMTARVELDTKEIRNLWLMIDSGANHPLLLETDSTDNYKPLAALETTIGRGLGGSIKGAFIRSGWLLMGNSRLDNIITSISSEYMSGNSAARNFRNGTIGSGALSRFIVSFDYTNSRLILKKGLKFGKPFEYNMSGITIECVSAGFNIFKVSEIIPGSPANNAGVLPDDLLISINGKAAFTLTLGELNGMLSRHPGGSITLVVNRDGELLTFKFKLERLI